MIKERTIVRKSTPKELDRDRTLLRHRQKKRAEDIIDDFAGKVNAIKLRPNDYKLRETIEEFIIKVRYDDNFLRVVKDCENLEKLSTALVDLKDWIYKTHSGTAYTRFSGVYFRSLYCECLRLFPQDPRASGIIYTMAREDPSTIVRLEAKRQWKKLR